MRALVLARLAALPTGIALGLTSADVAWEPALAISAVAICWILATNRRMSRRGLGRREALVLAAVDVAIVAAGIAASGGADSRMRLLLGVLPLAMAFAFRAPVVVGIGVGGGALLIPSGLDDPGGLAVNLVVGAWSTAVGLALVRDRRRLVGRMRRLAEVRERLLEAHDGAAARERDRAVDELRLGALDDVRAARTALVLPGGAGRAAELTRSAAGRIRGLVSELHALSARPIALRAAVGAVAARRAEQTGRTIAVRVDDAVEGTRDDLVLVLVRDLLDAITTHGSAPADLTVTVAAGDRGFEVAVRGAPLAAFDELGLALVRERLLGVPGAVLVVGDGLVTAILEDEPAREVPPPPGTPSAARASRRLGALAVPVIALICGTSAASFWIPTAIGFVAVVASEIAIARRPLPVRGRIAMTAIDAALIVSAVALAGPARDELLLLVVGFAPVYASIFAPRIVAVFVAGLGLGTLAVIGWDQAFVIGYGAAAVIAVALAVATERAIALATVLLECRREAFLSLLASEEAVRRSVARRLHDDALQLLLTARQDAEEAAQAADPAIGADGAQRARLALGEVEAQLDRASLRQEVDRAPQGGLATALEALVREAESESELLVVRAIDPAVAAVADGGLILGLARELVTNAVRHAQARRLTVTLGADGRGAHVLVVADDGRGMAPDRAAAALAEGHIGLAAARDRVRRRGGTLTLDATPGRGTVVTVVLPG
ncbi:sensor histidine kinase [Paraconexibacter algicola]|uniref:Histidine kinase domain-containing protein n=1 Tax=Paraconexibacter algicola TaxID=2133960 RepID=A0A2T4UGX6_9ACTN|nr:ATP-binding protein [Paraconexibacter algicola]PTL58492.1 hypothetical protein C7Y72_01890 [Paraconexibacter algicola]